MRHSQEKVVTLRAGAAGVASFEVDLVNTGDADIGEVAVGDKP